MAIMAQVEPYRSCLGDTLIREADIWEELGIHVNPIIEGMHYACWLEEGHITEADVKAYAKKWLDANT